MTLLNPVGDIEVGDKWIVVFFVSQNMSIDISSFRILTNAARPSIEP